MAIEKDVARDGKKTTGLIVAVIIVIVAGTYLIWGWLNQPDIEESQYDLSRVANNASVSNNETIQYRKLLHLSNTQGAKEAEQEGRSFIASLSEQQPVVTEKNAPPEPVALATEPAPDTDTATTDTAALSEETKKQLDDFLKQLNSRWKTGDMQLAKSFTAASVSKESNDAFAGWAQSIPGLYPPAIPAVQSAAQSPGKTQPEISVPFQIAALSRFPGVINTAVDSDNTGSVVLASVPAGKFSGMTLAAKGVQLAGDAVVIHLTDMQYKGYSCKTDAYALNDETLQSSVASDVSHRYFSRIILPALANGIGQVGQLYKDANTQILSANGGATITGRTGTPDGKAVAGVIAGGIGEKTAQVMAEDASRLPVTRVRVARNEVISVLFMKPVTGSDCTPTPEITGEKDALRSRR